jgi:hypothetical protein
VAFARLPGWQWLKRDFACAPDLAVGPGGEVIVSSNVLPVLWRVDAATFKVTRHDLRLESDGGRDVGFSRLEYSRKTGAYYATSGVQRSVWRIDAGLGAAHKIRDGADEPCAEL